MDIMRLYIFLFLLAGVVLSCTRNPATGRGYSSSEKKIRKQSVSVAEGYAFSQLKDARKTVMQDGVIIIGDKSKRYSIDPAKIYVGLIDDDSDEDAIVSFDIYLGQYQVMSEHLILIKTEGKMMLNREIESDMRVLGIKDRVITAEISTHSRNSPLFNCSSCKEIVNYHFLKGELIKME
jgi:hypothetical protein